MKKFKSLAIPDVKDLMFGRAPRPIRTRRGMVIGGGTVYPELNFTVPPMEITKATIRELSAMYSDVIKDACTRACELDSDGFVVEFETLIEMTVETAFAIELTKVISGILEDFHAKRGLKTALRITPNDARDMVRPPVMRSGGMLDAMMRAFEGCAKAGAEFLSIESTGGKEIHDGALLDCDISRVIFALSIMGCRDMDFLWGRIVDIAGATNTVPAGDTACAFGNTAMVLAERRYIPRVFAAAVRSASAVRSLVAYEKGAVGPGKDCGYENPFIKAITGVPISMEGKSAACAHQSPVGNITSAMCDLWSNESVQNVKLLGGMTPTISLEQLIYDCRLMNLSHQQHEEHTLQRLFVSSDAFHDPQALILAPANVLRIAGSIIRGDSYYHSTVNAVREALSIIRESHTKKELQLPDTELSWLSKVEEAVGGLPADEGKFIGEVYPVLDETKFIRADYGL